MDTKPALRIRHGEVRPHSQRHPARDGPRYLDRRLLATVLWHCLLPLADPGVRRMVLIIHISLGHGVPGGLLPRKQQPAAHSCVFHVYYGSTADCCAFADGKSELAGCCQGSWTALRWAECRVLLPTVSSSGDPHLFGANVEFDFRLSMTSYSKGGPRMWSMVFSVLVVGVSYVHTGIRLFDPTAKFSRKYFRAIPGSYVKGLLQFLEHRAACRGIRATIWTIPYLLAFAGYASVRAAYDVAESMLGEIIWLSFAIAWGSLKVWDTRSLVWVTQLDNGDIAFKNTYNDDDTWSFGQILPIVLLLLPILSMLQSYLDNDAKAQDAVRRESNLLITQDGKPLRTVGTAAVGSGTGTNDKQASSTHDVTSGGITRCNHRQPPSNTIRIDSTTPDENATPSAKVSSPPDSESQHPVCLPPNVLLAPVPRHPYPHLFAYHWYRDHVYLLVCQLLMIGCVILWVQGAIVSIVGISYILRSRLFLIWIFGFIPLSSLAHLAAWYLAASVVRRTDGAGEWLSGTGRYGCADGEGRRKWWMRMTRGRCVYYLLVAFLKGGLLTMTFLGSAVIAGPQNIDLGGG
ncbi:hypothetical protein PMIN05_005536 [Paraphaeosphaeria minitans]